MATKEQHEEVEMIVSEQENCQEDEFGTNNTGALKAVIREAREIAKSAIYLAKPAGPKATDFLGKTMWAEKGDD